MHGNLDMAQVMFGENARHVPAWLYVQHQGDDMVSFVGASRVAGHHPLRYGSDRTHQFILGEIIVRPHLIVSTDALRGYGLSGLATSDHNPSEMLAAGEILLGRWPSGGAW
ncbi:hypothetical protein ACFFX1_55310 [Dactylosporangium sucinum]|uniref:Uncharacterized protein n=1 Tax=Dactylosporangium sucinum TaxID=1424081 RepID=A0A917U2E7_9ACTN|nr:hypothetical protein [Dactylosporangium sucinum]GGM52846.1 hypothetical protein GCM10007977_063020 [Dactylosporangium sucinum]